jgi:hypothetical protein
MRDGTFLLIGIGIAVTAVVFVLMAGILYGVSFLLPDNPNKRRGANGDRPNDKL